MISRLMSWLGSPLSLAVAAVLVGVAIVGDGVLARAFNGIGGLLWLACCVTMIRARNGDPARWRTGAVLVGLAVVLAVVARPSDGLAAVVGFGVAAGVLAFVAESNRVAWSTLLPAVWLPVHLGIAIGRVAWRGLFGGEAAVRTDPPPTTAIVPLLMVLSAWGAGLLVATLRDGRRRREALALRPR